MKIKRRGIKRREANLAAHLGLNQPQQPRNPPLLRPNSPSLAQYPFALDAVSCSSSSVAFLLSAALTAASRWPSPAVSRVIPLLFLSPSRGGPPPPAPLPPLPSSPPPPPTPAPAHSPPAPALPPRERRRPGALLCSPCPRASARRVSPRRRLDPLLEPEGVQEVFVDHLVSSRRSWTWRLCFLFFLTRHGTTPPSSSSPPTTPVLESAGNRSR